MNYPTQKTAQDKRCVGRISPGMLALLLLVALAIAGVGYLAIQRANTNTQTTLPKATQEEIDAELGKLQDALQTTLQEKLDVSRIAAQARDFTQRYPEEAGGYILLAQARMAQQQWDDAYAAWKQAMAHGPAGFEVCKMAGLSAAKLGQNEQALTHYQQAIKATNDQADSEVYAAIGRLQLSLNNPDAAEKMFNRSADARGPGEHANFKHEAYAGLANVAVVRGQFDLALSWIDRAIKMANLDSKADLPGYEIQKARIYMDADRDEDALTWLSYTWSKHPQALWRIESARLRARLFERAGQLGQAADHIQTVTEWHRMAEQQNPRNLAEFTALLADWQIKAKRYDAARISLHNLQTLMPKHPAIQSLNAKLR